MPLNPDAPPPTVVERTSAALSRSREVVIFAAGMIAGIIAVLLGSLT